MKLNNTVTFNLQNTHKYTLGTASLAKYPDTLLALMVQHDGTEKELFISQDGELFRWICVFYNLGVLVDHKEAKCSEKVWDAYLDFFGLTPYDTSEKRACTEFIQGLKSMVVPAVSKSEKLKQVMKMIDWMIRSKHNYCHFPMYESLGFPYDFLFVVRYLTKDLLFEISEILSPTIECVLSLCKLNELYSLQTPAREMKTLLASNCQILRIEIKSQFITQ